MVVGIVKESDKCIGIDNHIIGILAVAHGLVVNTLEELNLDPVKCLGATNSEVKKGVRGCSGLLCTCK